MDGASIREWTEQDPFLTFSQCVDKLLKENGMTAAQLIKQSAISQTTVSRILRDANDKGATYRPTEKIVAAISITLKLDPDGYEALREIAFPELVIWKTALNGKKSVDDVNKELDDLGLPILTNFKKEDNA